MRIVRKQLRIPRKQAQQGENSSILSYVKKIQSKYWPGNKWHYIRNISLNGFSFLYKTSYKRTPYLPKILVLEKEHLQSHFFLAGDGHFTICFSTYFPIQVDNGLPRSGIFNGATFGSGERHGITPFLQLCWSSTYSWWKAKPPTCSTDVLPITHVSLSEIQGE